MIPQSVSWHLDRSPTLGAVHLGGPFDLARLASGTRERRKGRRSARWLGETCSSPERAATRPSSAGPYTMTRALIYARVSTDEQADRELSFPSQLEACRRHAAAQGWEVVGTLTDEGGCLRQSGRRIGGPE